MREKDSNDRERTGSSAADFAGFGRHGLDRSSTAILAAAARADRPVRPSWALVLFICLVRPLHGGAEPGPGPDALRRLPRHRAAAGPALGESVLRQEGDLAPGAELRDRASEGERRRRQSDRDRRGRGVAGRRHASRRSSRSTTTRTSFTSSRESALRNLATQYTYDSHGEGEKSLRGNTSRSPIS